VEFEERGPGPRVPGGALDLGLELLEGLVIEAVVPRIPIIAKAKQKRGVLRSVS
jgi:hypothetical protein